MPFRPGKLASQRRRVGRKVRLDATRAQAVRRLPPTTSMPGVAVRILRRPRRTSLWSSTKSTWI